MSQTGNLSIQDESTEAGSIDYTVVVIYTYAVYSVSCQVINIFGIITNIINIVCFVKQGFKDPINISFVGLSISDLCNVITMAMTCAFLTPALAEADIPFDSLDVTYMTVGMTHISFSRVSSCITAMITVERCLSIVSPLKVKSIVTPRKITVIVVCIFVIFTFSIAPVYVVNKLGFKFSPVKNKTLIGLVSRDDKDAVEKITFLINSFLIPFGSFVTVAVCTVILSTQLRIKAEWRKTTTSEAQADRISSRNLKVGKMVVTISTLFIICFVPTAVMMLTLSSQPVGSFSGKYYYVLIMLGGFGYLFEGINASVNIVIYHHMSSNYRDTFRKLFIGGKGRDY